MHLPEIIAIKHVCEAVRSTEHQKAEIISSTAQAIKDHCMERGAEILQDLEQAFKAMREIGCPPTFVNIAGLKNKEPPLNNLLEWWAKSDSEHGMTKQFLIGLADLIDFKEMVADLKTGEIDQVEVFANQRIPGSDSKKRPDLAVRTRNTAIILENKYNSPESDEEQYPEYRDRILPKWAEARKNSLAVFCCPENYEYNRPTKGWCCKTHEDLAVLFRDLAKKTDGTSHWGRIAAIVTAGAFNRAIFPHKGFEETYTLLKEMRAVRPFLIVHIYQMLKQREKVQSLIDTLKEFKF